jgi:hypothetical protein
MSLRLGSWIENIKYFIQTYWKWRLGKPIGQRRRMIKNLLDFVSLCADNIYYFFRIGLFDFSSKEMELLVSRIGTVPTIISYAQDIILAYYDCKKKAAGDAVLMKKLLNEKRTVFISKFCEFPMQFYYLSVWWAKIKRGDAAAFGLVSPIIFMFKHFDFLKE